MKEVILFQIPTRSVDIPDQISRFKSRPDMLIIFNQSSYFKSRPDLLTLGGVGGGNQKSWKTFRVEESGIYSVDRISKCRRYVIAVTLLNLLSLGGGVQCFGEFGASGRAKTMKIISRVRELHKLA